MPILVKKKRSVESPKKICLTISMVKPAMFISISTSSTSSVALMENESEKIRIIP